MMHFTRAILLTTIIINSIFIAGLLPKARRNWTYKFLIMHLVAIILWAGSILFLIWYPDFSGVSTYTQGDLGYAISKIVYIGAALMLASQVGFMKFFPHKSPKPAKSDYVILLGVCLILIIALIDNGLFSEVTIQPNGSSQIVRGPLTPLYSAYTILFLIWPNILLYRKWKKEHNPIVRNQLRILLVSYVVFETLSAVTNWILPVYFQVNVANALGPAFSLILAGGMAYASSHYRLLDLRLSLQRTLTYVSATAIVGVVLLYIFFYQPAISKVDILLIDTITILTALVAYSGLTKVLSPVFNMLIFRKTRNYLDVLRTATHQISRSSMSIPDAFQEILATVQKALGVRGCDLVFQTADNGFYQPVRGQSEPMQLPSHSRIVRWLDQNHRDALVKEELTYELQMEGSTPMVQREELQKIKAEMDSYYVAIAIPITDNQNNLVAVLLLNEKFNDQLFSTQEIRELKLFLEHMTFYIYNAKLYFLLQKKLENNQNVEKEFMKGLFHEVRTPLTIAQSSIEALQWTESQEERKEYIGKATSQIQKSSHILADFSDILALEQGKITLQRREVPFLHIIETALGRVQEQLTEKDIRIGWKNKRAFNTKVSLDIDRMTNTMAQVLDNAIRFHHQSGGKINLSAGIKNGALLVHIEDNGIGIAKEDLVHVFEKFYRADKAKNIHQGGPGLGLAYARAVMEAHQGKIEIRSRTGKGTQVTITVPLSSFPKKK